MKKEPFHFVIICFLISSICGQAQVETDAFGLVSNDSTHVKFQTHFYEAIKQKTLENYSKAIEELESCKALRPLESVIFHELGINYFNQKQLDSAEFNFQKAISLDEANFWYKESLYHLYVDQNRYEAAILAVEPLLSRHPNYKQDLANLYLNAKRYSEALMVLDDLDATLGYDALRDRIRNEVYDQSGNNDHRITDLKRRLLEAPELPTNFLNLVYAYSQLNQKKEAFETAQAFLKYHPKSHLVHVALYKFYLDDKAYEKAIESMKIVTTSTVVSSDIKVKVLNDFMSFVVQFPEYKSALLEVTNTVAETTPSRSDVEWGDYYYNQKAYSKALPYYTKALKFDPANFKIIKNVAFLYLETNQFEKAAEFTNNQLELYPTQPHLYLVNGTANKHLNKLDVAIEFLSMGLDFVIDNKTLQIDFYKQLSSAYLLKDNIQESKAFTKKATLLEQKP